MKKILIIEDYQLTVKTYAWMFKDLLKGKEEKYKLFFTDSVEGARKIFLEIPDISLVVFDGNINGPLLVNPSHGVNPNDEYPNSVVLVYEFRKTSDIPMIAASHLEYCRKVLIEAGCDYECDDKDQVPKRVIEILGLG